MATLRLIYDPKARGSASGWYLPANSFDSWIAAAAHEPSVTTKMYLAPGSNADRTAVGLIALRTENSDARPVPSGAVPLVCSIDKRSGVELWLPMFSRLSINASLEELFATQYFEKTKRLVWLPPDRSDSDRLIGLTEDDEVDLSILVKPVARNLAVAGRTWQAPPEGERLPAHIVGLKISREMLEHNPFIAEQESIGGDSDDLMEIDEHGNPNGGGLGARAGRMFRKGLEKVVKSLKSKQPKSDEASPTKPDQSQSKATPQNQGSANPPMAQSLYQKLQSMLADQREKQIKKLLDLMARDPDRALKYAVPMASQAAPRGVAQPGGNLGQNNTDFSLSNLFGGGQLVDPWQLDAQLQARLMAAYRSQADREMAAGRYRRAAYIYAHLLGDLNAAAMVLEKGKFFIEAAVLYERLQRPIDQARCLHKSGQLAEAALIYERLNNFEAAAEMWAGVGDHVAARAAYGKAVEAALERHEVLKAVTMMEEHLDQRAFAESVLWNQWPRGHQVLECMELAFGRLAEQGRIADAHRRFDSIISQTDRTEHALLARLCVKLAKSFPDPELRARLEDQCRVSAVDHLSTLSRAEVNERMQILSSLHRDDVLLHRDIRRFERNRPKGELTLKPDPAHTVPRGKLITLPSVKLEQGKYLAGMVIDKQLLAISQHENELILTRAVDLTQEFFSTLKVKTALQSWDTGRPPVAHLDPKCSPRAIYVGYQTGGPNSVNLTSSKDDLWTIYRVGCPQGETFLGIGNDGIHWYWNMESFELIAGKDNLPCRLINCESFINSFVGEFMDDMDSDFKYYPPPGPLAVVLGNQPYIAFHRTIATVIEGEVREVATVGSRIDWMVPSLMTRPRLLVAGSHELWLVSLTTDERPEKLISDETFIKAAFLPGGRIAAATSRELFLFQSGRNVTKLVDRQPIQLSQVVAVLPLSVDTIGVLLEHGVIQRWRINYGDTAER